MTAFMPVYEMVDQPKVVDITAGRPFRLTGIPVPLPATGMTNISYWLEFLSVGDFPSVLFGMGPEDMPAFDLTGQQTAQLGTLMAAASPCGFDNTGDKTAVGSYRIFAQGTDPNTTEAVTASAGYGPALLRLSTRLTRKDRILLGQGTCGCVAASSAGCGCGGGCSSCDHPVPGPDPDPCNALVERAMTKGRWRGPFSDLNPPDNLGPYIRWDVVVMPDGREYAFVGPVDGVSPCHPPGANQP